MASELVELASNCGNKITALLTSQDKKRLGHFLTPSPIAQFMAKKIISGFERETVRVIEPAAGSGVLAAAVVDALLESPTPPKRIHLILFEIDSRLISALKRIVQQMRIHAKRSDVVLSASIRNEDFLLSPEARKQNPIADIIISNPPYFKINAKDPRTKHYQYAIHGQPNIYGLFMAVCAGLIRTGGKWCFITPRSWTNGAYFSAVRRVLLKNLKIEAIHVFNSRIDHFQETDILQEAMITWAAGRSNANGPVHLSSSHGSRDLHSSRFCMRPIDQVVGADNEQQISISIDSSLPLSIYSSTLATYGLKVSTGRVIAFRSKDFISENGTSKTMPLLWMQHISHNKISWPINKKKEHVLSAQDSKWMLIANTPMVILRRFSPKEDKRRVTAAAYSGLLPGNQIGLENHLNYIYRPSGKMTFEESRGLAAFLNSTYVDAYFRSIAGSTQINAGELRKLPLPPMDKLLMLGKKCSEGIAFEKMDLIINDVLPELLAQGKFSKQG